METQKLFQKQGSEVENTFQKKITLNDDEEHHENNENQPEEPRIQELDSPKVDGSPVSDTAAAGISYKVSFSLSVMNHMIYDLFRKTCKANDFILVEEDMHQGTAIRDTSDSWSRIFRCLEFRKSRHPYVVVRINVYTNTVKCAKTVVVRGICGKVNILKKFVNDFKTKVQNAEKTSLGYAFSHAKMANSSFFSDISMHEHFTNRLPTNGTHRDRFPPTPPSIKEEEEEGSHMKTNLESYSIYHFNKILSSDAYSLGKKVSDFLRDFTLNHRNVEESAELLPQPIESIVQMTNETVDTLFFEFNYGKAETRKIMPYCRFAVEKYLFEKLYECIFPMYLLKNREMIEDFRAMKEKLSTSTLQRVLTSLDIPKKFWLFTEARGSDLLSMPLKEIPDMAMPYASAIIELDKMEKLRNPREKLNCLLMLQSLMRSSVVDYYKGKEELASMDDELPIVIFIVLCSDNHNLPADLNLIEDYISFENDFDHEQRLLTNIKVSVQYIAKEWKI
eukprot:TRINITY_DN3392_c0_g1_i7.p1 TRINITY_DN3392_c0_g1~~TRINITY_DN3392_c0_g1_i7.p1  ORF type:complete len:505 (-),score=100.34 TRINITY_DN3392_c0_g1_i7:133-1647(-)